MDVLCCAACALRYYTERAGPDPSTTPYYQSVPMAMWVTMLNLAGEAPLCDYTAWGKVSRLPTRSAQQCRTRQDRK